MDEHIERACAGLRALGDSNLPVPDYFLYLGDRISIIPNVRQVISGISVIRTPAYLGGIDFGMVHTLLYLPCYNDLDGTSLFIVYKEAYDDWEDYKDD